MPLETTLLIVAALLGLSVVASKAASKLGVPVLVVFIAIGMLAGSDGIGGLWFSDIALARDVGIVALAFILFSGGMDTDWRAIRPQLAPALSLSIVGVAATALVIGFFVHLLLGFTLGEGLLLGAIISSTDAAAVFVILRGQAAQLKGEIQAVLELESGTNDPTAIFLTVATLAIVKGATVSWALPFHFLTEMAGGGLWGYLMGFLGVLAMRRLRLEFDALYHVVSLSLVLFAFAGAEVVGANGFLAVYVAGLTYGAGDFRQRKGLRRFHEGIAWLMQITLFLVLGLLVFPRTLPAIAASGALVALVLIFVARPLGVLLALAPFRRFGWPERGLVAWTGLRGAVPIILAMYPLLEGIERAGEIFNLVFFVVLISALLQGATLPWIAARLRLVQGSGSSI